MSLILEALKKSEQERRRERGPDLHTIHQPLPARAPQRSRAAWWGAALILANVGVLMGWWLQQRSSHAPAGSAAVIPASATVSPAVAAPSNPKPEARPAMAPPAVTKPVAEESEYTNIAPGSALPDKPAGAAPVSRRQPPIKELVELPEAARSALPAMTFSFHVYSSDPQKRTIIINNRRLREGDEIGGGVELQEITEDGVILSTPEHRIHIGVLAGW